MHAWMVPLLLQGVCRRSRWRWLWEHAAGALVPSLSFTVAMGLLKLIVDALDGLQLKLLPQNVEGVWRIWRSLAMHRGAK